MGLLVEYQVRPTVLIPVWKLAGFTLGAGCSLLGEKGAMACTVAVEALVTKHYDDQVTEIGVQQPEVGREADRGDQEVPRRRAEPPRHRACTWRRGSPGIQFPDCCYWIWMQECYLDIRENIKLQTC